MRVVIDRYVSHSHTLATSVPRQQSLSGFRWFRIDGFVAGLYGVGTKLAGTDSGNGLD